MKSPEVEAYWQEFCAISGVTNGRCEAFGFGDSPAMMDELLALVLSGKKRATAGLLRDFDEQSLPRAGDYAIILDGKGEPGCIYRSAEIRVGPLSSVDDKFAWDEGEGDRTRTWWLAAHTDFFKRQAKREGFAFHDDIETVFERFRVVWPIADAV